jgi:hypothetical protein
MVGLCNCGSRREDLTKELIQRKRKEINKKVRIGAEVGAWGMYDVSCRNVNIRIVYGGAGVRSIKSYPTKPSLRWWRLM